MTGTHHLSATDTRKHFSGGKSATAVASKVALLVCVPGTGPGCFWHNHTTQQHVNKYNTFALYKAVTQLAPAPLCKVGKIHIHLSATSSYTHCNL
jgi:hypothetical protein